jgi:hypothetical protein
MRVTRPIGIERLKELATIAPNALLNRDSAAELRALAAELLDLRHVRDDLDAARAKLRDEQGARAELRIEINRARRAMVQIQSIVRSHFPGGLPATVAKQVLDLAFFEESDGPEAPLDELAENLVADLHQLASGPGTTTEDRRLEILFSKAHALALVLADTRRRLLAMESDRG